jgi:hypothetical protein
MIYRVVIEQLQGNKTTTVFNGDLAGEGVGQVARIADQIRGGYYAGEGGKVIVKSITYVGGEAKKVEDLK